MSSMRGFIVRGKKPRHLGNVEVIDRSNDEAMELDTKVELILELIRLGSMHVEEALAEEVRQLAGERQRARAIPIPDSSARGRAGAASCAAGMVSRRLISRRKEIRGIQIG